MISNMLYRFLNVDYINGFSGSTVSVDYIMQYSGADKLRVYPALFELEQSGWLEVVEREELGAPTVVRMRKDMHREDAHEEKCSCTE